MNSIEKRRWYVRSVLLYAMALALITAACQPPPGSVVDGGQKCQLWWRAGECSGKYLQLSGTYIKVFTDSSIAAGSTVPLIIRASTTQGAVRITVPAADGTVSTMDLQPGQPPVTLTVTTAAQMEQFAVMFQALEGSATGISYRVSYLLP